MHNTEDTNTSHSFNGPLVSAHRELFPKVPDDPQAKEKRRNSFAHRARQAFGENETLADEIVGSEFVADLIDRWTNLRCDTIERIGQWYQEAEDSLSKEQKHAIIFFGSFSIETLYINLKHSSRFKAVVQKIWVEHAKLFDAYSKDEVRSFIHRVMLMVETPIVPEVLGDPDHDEELRTQAYMHFSMLYQIDEGERAGLAEDAKFYSTCVVSDEPTGSQLQSEYKRGSKVKAMWEDIAMTFNMSRQYHRKVLGVEEMRPDLAI